MISVKQRYLSLDLETLSLSEDALVFSIGIVPFCIDDSLTPVEELRNRGVHFQMNLSEQTGRTASMSTLLWWQDQGVENLSDFSGSSTIQEVRDWIEENVTPQDKWVIKGDKDMLWLASLLGVNTSQRDSNFYYRNVLDLRTMMHFSEITEYKNPNPHNALWDAVYQAKQAIDCIFSLSVPNQTFWYYEIPLGFNSGEE